MELCVTNLCLVGLDCGCLWLILCTETAMTQYLTARRREYWSAY